jgi:putative integral membrane protein (TIGR02587 family)
MASSALAPRGPSKVDREFVIGLGRAFAGALIFALPMLMTMEMWWLGFYMHPLRLALLVVVILPLLVGLSRLGGFRPTSRLRDEVADAFVACLVAAAAAAIILYAFGLVTADMTAREIVGKITLQAVPGSIGAMLARNQLHEASLAVAEKDPKVPSYGGELFLMAVGALFLGFNVAPTEEMIFIAYKMTVWREISLVALSLALMHGFVFAVNFRGGGKRAPGISFASVFARFTLVGYAIVLLVSLYILWTFGRVDGLSLEETISASLVLGFPGAIGAALARLVL